jgi:Domain of unknown function (DUF4331)
MYMRSLTNPVRFLVASMLALVCASAHASDHLDTAAVIADPASDIGDLYAWASGDGKRLNLVMTIVGGKFSDHVRYEFHVDSGKTLGKTTATTSISCEFNSAFAPDCRVGDVDRARGDASGEDGLQGERHRFRVFAGVRDDPFFNNVKGTRAALNVAGAAMAAGASKDGAGCPHFDANTSAKILDEWRHTEGHGGSNLLAGWNTAALVIEIDLDVVNGGGPLLGVWATTTVRGVTPGHKHHLDDGLPIDRMGRALTGNALVGLFATEPASDARKTQYNQAPPAEWSSFASDIAASLAMYDGFDGQCGNQWLSAENRPRAGRYSELAQLLADDRLWVNSNASSCRQYLSAELHHGRAAKRDCGGRTTGYDAVDVFRSLLVLGRTSGVDDGVVRDDGQHSDLSFPFLAPSTPVPR